MFSWARRPLGTGTLSLSGNAAKRRAGRQEQQEQQEKDPLGPLVRRDLRGFLPFLAFLPFLLAFLECSPQLRRSFERQPRDPREHQSRRRRPRCAFATLRLRVFLFAFLCVLCGEKLPESRWMMCYAFNDATGVGKLEPQSTQ